MPPESTADRRWKFPVLPFIVGETPPPAGPTVVDALARFYVPDISDVVGRMYTVHNIRSIFDPAIALVGPATCWWSMRKVLASGVSAASRCCNVRSRSAA
jgi:hypothetical protein